MMNNENGRSMVEMLGVLAIIGVLSVAGIAGYTIAMNKYRANEIVNTASQLVILAKAKSAGTGGTASFADLGISSAGGATNIVADCSNGADPCEVTVTNWPSNDVKSAAQTMVGTSAHYTIS